MRYEDIKFFYQRCEEHPDHQSGMVSHQMLLDRAHEEIDELREYIEQRTWVGLTNEEIETIWRKVEAGDFHDCVLPFAEKLEARLKEKNT